MPTTTPNYTFTFTKEMKMDLYTKLAGFNMHKMYGTSHNARVTKIFTDMAKKNEQTQMPLLNCCFIGPVAMSKILIAAGFDIADMSFEKQTYCAVILEEMFGLSTKFVYNEKKQAFEPIREVEEGKKYGDVFTYREEELKLGLWDRICSFFGVETDNAKRVNFIKHSLSEQKRILEGMNKDLAGEKRAKYLNSNEAKYNANKEAVKNIEAGEASWKKAFFGDKEVKDFKFDNGKKLSALSACVAMYKKEYGENICEKTPAEALKDSGTAEKMKAVADKYLAYQGLKSKMGMGTDLPISDLKILADTAYGEEFAVDYDKNVADIDELRSREQRDHARLENNYVVLKMKVEMAGLRKESEEYALTEQEKALAKESVKIKTEIKLYEDIRDRKYENIAKHLKTMDSKIEIDKDASCQQLVDYAQQFSEKNSAEKEMEIDEEIISIN